MMNGVQVWEIKMRVLPYRPNLKTLIQLNRLPVSENFGW